MVGWWLADDDQILTLIAAISWHGMFNRTCHEWPMTGTPIEEPEGQALREQGRACAQERLHKHRTKVNRLGEATGRAVYRELSWN
jgi:hypothetical protein